MYVTFMLRFLSNGAPAPVPSDDQARHRKALRHESAYPLCLLDGPLGDRWRLGEWHRRQKRYPRPLETNRSGNFEALEPPGGGGGRDDDDGEHGDDRGGERHAV